jgi:hypothetical protein
VEKSKRTIIEEVAQGLEEQVERLRGVKLGSPDSPWEWESPHDGTPDRTWERVLAEAAAVEDAARRLWKVARFAPSLPRPPGGYEGDRRRRERLREDEQHEEEKSWREPRSWKEQAEMYERGELWIG